MSELDTQALEGFLRFPFVGWLRELSLASFDSLMQALFAKCLVNFTMLRTITNALETTAQYRECLRPDRRDEFASAEISIRKSGDEGLMWNYGVFYIVFRNIRKLAAQDPSFFGLFDEMKAFCDFEIRGLRRDLQSEAFSRTLALLSTDKICAHTCLSESGAKRTATALARFDDEQVRRALTGLVSKTFIYDVLLYKNGKNQGLDEYSTMLCQDGIIKGYLRQKTPVPEALGPLLADVLALPTDERHACLYHANLVEMGLKLGQERNAAPLLAKLKDRVDPLYHLLVYGAYSGKLKLASLSSTVCEELAIQFAWAKLFRP